MNLENKGAFTSRTSVSSSPVVPRPTPTYSRRGVGVVRSAATIPRQRVSDGDGTGADGSRASQDGRADRRTVTADVFGSRRRRLPWTALCPVIRVLPPSHPHLHPHPHPAPINILFLGAGGRRGRVPTSGPERGARRTRPLFRFEGPAGRRPDPKATFYRPRSLPRGQGGICGSGSQISCLGVFTSLPRRAGSSLPSSRGFAGETRLTFDGGGSGALGPSDPSSPRLSWVRRPPRAARPRSRPPAQGTDETAIEGARPRLPTEKLFGGQLEGGGEVGDGPL